MNAKLTLRLDEDVIRRAKDYSRDVGKPVSRLVENYFVAVTAPSRPLEEKAPPLVASLRGVLADSTVGEPDYRAHLEKKYG